MTSINAQGNASSGAALLSYLQATEYRFTRGVDGNQESMSVWRGTGAAALGLVGNVDLEDMNKLARGFAPDGTTALRKNAGQPPKWVPEVDDKGQPRLDDDGNPRGKWTGPRIGFDSTFSAPKSVSLSYAMAVADSDFTMADAILAAHHKAVDRALQSMETHLETRRGHGGVEVIGGVDLAVSRHTHFAGREAEDKNGRASWDPQLHSHCLVYNVCRGPDGQWSTFDSGTLYNHALTFGALYRAQLASEMQALGFSVVKTPVLDSEGDETTLNMFEVVGVPESVRQEYSKRTTQMGDWMEANDSTDTRLAAVATRKNKDEPVYTELVQLWKRALDETRAQNPECPQSIADIQKAPAPVLQPIDDEALLEKLHKNTSVFDRKELVLHIAQEYVGLVDASGAEKEADAFVRRMVEQQKLVLIEPHRRADDAPESKSPGHKHTDVRFAAQFVIDLEQQLLDRTRERKDEPGVRISKASVDKAIQESEASKSTSGKPFKMTAEQKEAVHYLCAGSGGVATMTGYAGAGKTSTMNTAVAALKAEGRTFIGTSTSWKAANNLEAETGVKSYSIAQLKRDLAKGKTKLDEKTVLVVDEAGMVGTRDLHALSEQCATAKAKLIILGDPRQLQPVTWGAPMRLLEQEGHTKLTEIRRQQTQEGRDIANLFYELPGKKPGSRSREASLGQSAKIWKRLEKNGMVRGFDNKHKAMEQMAKDWSKSGFEERHRLVLCSSNADVNAMNQVMRAHAKSTGRLSEQEFTMTRLTKHGQKRELPLAQGDRIAFTKKMSLPGVQVVNGDQAIITGIRSGQYGGLDITARLESDIAGKDGRQVSWNTDTHGRGTSIRHSWAMTVHKSQGLGRSHVMLLAHPGMTDEATALVGFTRTKDEFAVYGDYDGLDQVKDRLATERLALNALEEGVRQPNGKAKSPAEHKERKAPSETFLDRLNERMALVGLLRPDPQAAAPAATPVPQQMPVQEPSAAIPFKERLRALWKRKGIEAAPQPQAKPQAKPVPARTKPQTKPTPAKTPDVAQQRRSRSNGVDR